MPHNATAEESVNAGNPMSRFAPEALAPSDAAIREVNPSYYKDLDPEPIVVIEKWGLGYHLGQVVKYVARAGKKVVEGDARQSRLLDLRKARWYLDREIARMEGESEI